ncbi:protein AMN1 homolog [Myripristis murdjan]|uniref:Protein AMN1 homolog n=1 Tax=Myripristis murdjan TaxID=586833 RepID=A0A667XXA5_9TELE|nr:protein AMN1 homolog [Myripristis murdjan]
MPVDSLFDICVEYVADTADSFLSGIRNLPVEIKDELVPKLSTRMKFTNENISQLLHPGIKSLNLGYCQISDLALQQICCPHLKTINLTNCRRITSAGVIALVSSCPNLKEVDLKNCDGVTDEAVSALAHTCRDLEVLSLEGCSMVGDAALLALAENCRLLHALCLSGTQVTDVGITGFVTGLCSKNLNELGLSRCPNLTDESFEAVITNCPKLSTFLFYDCPHMTGQAWVSRSNCNLKFMAWSVDFK